MKSYCHEPLTNFADERNKRSFQEAIAFVESQLGKEYPLVIGEETIFTEKKTFSINPSKKVEIIGKVSMADQELAEKAMQDALRTFETWKKWKPESRANIIFRAAAMLRRENMNFRHIW
jgi:1-pyrroline-5-carboxylate dehydrogenase